MSNGQASNTDWLPGMSVSALQPHSPEALMQSGIRCIEITWRPDPDKVNITSEDLAPCRLLIEQARAVGLQIWSLHLPFGDEWDISCSEPDQQKEAVLRHEQLIAAAAGWGIPKLIIHPSFEPIPASERPLRLVLAREALGRLGRTAAAAGIHLAVECLPRSCLGNQAEEIAYLLTGNPELGVCCDVNHLFRETPAAFIRQIADRLISLHISDNDGLDERHWYPGEGMIDWPQTLAALREIGYSGAFIYEVRQQMPSLVAANWKQLNAH